MNNAMIQQKVRVGLLGVGLDTYWGQFEGLLPRLLTYQDSCQNRGNGRTSYQYGDGGFASKS